MKPVMYLIASTGVVMTPGKLAAQVAHAAVEAFRISTPSELVDAWYVGGHHTKIVVGSDDLLAASIYLTDRNFAHHVVIDEGRTEFNNQLTPTCIGCALVDKDDEHTAATFSSFKLYKPPSPTAIIQMPDWPKLDADANGSGRRSRLLPWRSRTERANYPNVS